MFARFNLSRLLALFLSRLLALFGAVAILLLVFGSAALAQGTGSPPPTFGVGQLILQGLFAPSTLSVLLPLLAAGLVWWIRDRAVQAAHGDAAAEAHALALANQRLAVIDWAAEVAYHGVTNISKFSPEVKLDKVSIALELFRQGLASHGVTPTDMEVARAKLAWNANHGREQLILGTGGPVPAAQVAYSIAALPAPGAPPAFIPDGAAPAQGVEVALHPSTPPGAK